MSSANDPTKRFRVRDPKSASVQQIAEPKPKMPKLANKPETAIEVKRIPKMGMPAFLYKLNKLFNPDAKVPNPNKKERQLWDAEVEAIRLQEQAAQAVQDRKDSIAYMRDQSDAMPHATVAFLAVKGAGGTTTTMVNTTSILADITRTTVYGVDFNPASGSAGGRLGKDYDDTISVREFGKLLDEKDRGDNAVLSRQTVNASLRPTRYGVRVLIADDYTLETTEQFGTKTREMLDTLVPNCDYLCIDTANDITTAPMIAVLGRADVLVFTANVGVRDSLRLLYNSMEKVRQLEKAGKLPAGKAANSVVVITGIPDGKTIEDYSDYVNQVNLKHEVIRAITPDEFEGKMLGVPFDDFISSDGEVDLEALQPETYKAYLDVCNNIFEQVAVSRQTH